MSKHGRKPTALFTSARTSFEKKVSMLGRYGITDVSCSAPFEKVDAKKFKPEGCHIQLWLVLLEQASPRLAGYSLELLHPCSSGVGFSSSSDADLDDQEHAR